MTNFLNKIAAALGFSRATATPLASAEAVTIESVDSKKAASAQDGPAPDLEAFGERLTLIGHYDPESDVPMTKKQKAMLGFTEDIDPKSIFRIDGSTPSDGFTTERMPSGALYVVEDVGFMDPVSLRHLRGLDGPIDTGATISGSIDLSGPDSYSEFEHPVIEEQKDLPFRRIPLTANEYSAGLPLVLKLDVLYQVIEIMKEAKKRDMFDFGYIIYNPEDPSKVPLSFQDFETTSLEEAHKLGFKGCLYGCLRMAGGLGMEPKNGHFEGEFAKLLGIPLWLGIAFTRFPTFDWARNYEHPIYQKSGYNSVTVDDVVTALEKLRRLGTKAFSQDIIEITG